MSNGITTPTPPPSSSAPPSLSWWQSLVASMPATALALSAIWVIGRPLGQALPGLVTLAVTTKVWQPAAACALALGLVAAPVPTLELARSVLSRLPLLGGKKG
jgi:hypothetical protein